MICFITDKQGDEPELLTREVIHNDLVIVNDLGEEVARFSAPKDGWRHTSLSLYNSTKNMMGCSFDAYLGNTFVGSSEI